MLFLLRKIRRKLMQKNKFTTYLLYAIGEIILVVIGILIAVSINNWNQKKKDQAAEKVLLIKVLSDLESDFQVIKKSKRTAERIQEFHQDCFSIILNRRKASDVVFQDPNLVRRTMYYNPLTRDNHPDLVNRISNQETKEQASTYYRWMKVMDEAYLEYAPVVLQIRRYISLQKGHNLAALYQKDQLAFNMDGNVTLVTRDKVRELLQDEYFQQLLLESNLKIQDARGSLDSLIIHNENLRSMIEKIVND